MHQDERLFLIHTHMRVAPAFPSSLLDEPARWQLDFSICIGIMRNVGILLLQCLKLFRADDRILEKAARVANLLYVR